MKRSLGGANPRQPGRIFALVALLIIGLALLVRSFRPAAEETDTATPAPVASSDHLTVYATEGNVSILGRDGSVRQVSHNDASEIAPGESIHVAAASRGSLTFGGALIVDLRAASRLMVRELGKTPLVGTHRASLRLDSGKAVCFVSGQAIGGAQLSLDVGPARVESDSGILECVSYGEGQARVLIYQGEATVTMGETSLRLGEQQEAEITLGSPLRAVYIDTPAPQPPSIPTPTALPESDDAAQGRPEPTAVPFVYESYTVQSDDTLSGIAQEHGLSWTALWEANREAIADPEVLIPGQIIRIPVADR